MFYQYIQKIYVIFTCGKNFIYRENCPFIIFMLLIFYQGNIGLIEADQVGMGPLYGIFVVIGIINVDFMG